jgi:hypothetical protein
MDSSGIASRKRKKKKKISTPFGISLHLWVRRCNTNWNSPSNGNNSLSGIYPFGWNLYRRNNASPRMKWDNFSSLSPT